MKKILIFTLNMKYILLCMLISTQNIQVQCNEKNVLIDLYTKKSENTDRRTEFESRKTFAPITPSSEGSESSTSSATFFPTPSIITQQGQNQEQDLTLDKDLQSEVFINLYDALDGKNWKNKDNWMSSESVCSWKGVICEDDVITHLELPSNNMKGKFHIVKLLKKLPGLQKLNIRNNDLEIIIFSEKEEHSLTSNLEILNLNNIDLKETFESLFEYVNFPELRELHMSSCGIDYEEFPFFEKIVLPKIEKLDFHDNRFHNIPWEFERMKNLQFLSLKHNVIKNKIPKMMGHRLPNLKVLNLAHNFFNGDIPESIMSLAHLEVIDLSGQTFESEDCDKGQGLTGPLLAFADKPALRYLDFSENCLSGTIPKDFLDKSDPYSFEFIGLEYNKLSGEIPYNPVFNVLDDNNGLELYDNRFTLIDSKNCQNKEYGCASLVCPIGTYNEYGYEDDEENCLSCATNLYLGSTSCETEEELPLKQNLVPPTVAKQVNQPTTSTDDKIILMKFYQTCGGDEWYRRAGWTKSVNICEWEGIKCLEEHVQAMNLASNNINCEPPSDILTLPYLERLSLYNNPLGSFDFSQIALAKNLTALLLDATGLTSIAGIEKAPKLHKLNLRYNSLEGELPIELKQLKSLKFLSLSNNKFDGKLLDIFENMPNLETLLLQSNKFSGELSMFKLPNSVTIFDISDNEFSGPIESIFLSTYPTDWATAKHIEVDLSDNMLTGTVPATFARFESINLYLKGNYIDGISPELCVKTQWNDGDVGAFGCDGLLCPYKTWASSGRSTKTHICGECSSAHYFGSDTCSEPIGSKSKNSASSNLVRTDGIILFIIIPLNIASMLIAYL